MPRVISKSTGHRMSSSENGNSLAKKKSIISEVGRSTQNKNVINNRTCNRKNDGKHSKK